MSKQPLHPLNFSYVAAATKYAQDIVAKKIPASKKTIQCCKRQLNDLKKKVTDMNSITMLLKKSVSSLNCCRTSRAQKLVN